MLSRTTRAALAVPEAATPTPSTKSTGSGRGAWRCLRTGRGRNRIARRNWRALLRLTRRCRTSERRRVKDSKVCLIGAMACWPLSWLLLVVLEVEGGAQLFGALCFVLAVAYTAGWLIGLGREK